MFYIPVWLALDDIYNFKSGFLENVHDPGSFEKIKVDINLLIQELIEMNGIVTNMKGKQKFSARSQNPFYFSKCRFYLIVI